MSRTILIDTGTHVCVPDPDNQMGSPAYEGPIEDAGMNLLPGDYEGHALDVEGADEDIVVIIAFCVASVGTFIMGVKIEADIPQAVSQS